MILRELKPDIIGLIGELKRDKAREKPFDILLKEGTHETTIKARITLISGHWTPIGSAMVRFENFPFRKDDASYVADFGFLLLEPITATTTIPASQVHLNGLSTNPTPAELVKITEWLGVQVSTVWNA